MAVVAGREVLRDLFVADLLEPFRGAETAVGVAAGDEGLGGLPVVVLPLTLDVGTNRTTNIRAFVPLQAEPLETVHQPFGRALDEPLLVGVLDAEDDGALAPRSLGLSVREEDVVHDEAGAPDVEGAGGTGGEAHADLVETSGQGRRVDDGHAAGVLCGDRCRGRWRGCEGHQALASSAFKYTARGMRPFACTPNQLSVRCRRERWQRTRRRKGAPCGWRWRRRRGGCEHQAGS